MNLLDRQKGPLLQRYKNLLDEKKVHDFSDKDKFTNQLGWQKVRYSSEPKEVRDSSDTKTY